eukprot:TRINITY_DN3000_c0_g2_i1.p1 TRINITY_DN3000_c0_g2~~TRINITY_DN3000_c0_g2_i1.p1  ORF type:complete len:483 (+),score=80.01 TRINITY_DN3000_c0_g2_i1:211-1449(+)
MCAPVPADRPSVGAALQHPLISAAAADSVAQIMGGLNDVNLAGVAVPGDERWIWPDLPVAAVPAPAAAPVLLDPLQLHPVQPAAARSLWLDLAGSAAPPPVIPVAIQPQATNQAVAASMHQLSSQNLALGGASASESPWIPQQAPEPPGVAPILHNQFSGSQHSLQIPSITSHGRSMQQNLAPSSVQPYFASGYDPFIQQLPFQPAFIPGFIFPPFLPPSSLFPHAGPLPAPNWLSANLGHPHISFQGFGLCAIPSNESDVEHNRELPSALFDVALLQDLILKAIDDDRVGYAAMATDLPPVDWEAIGNINAFDRKLIRGAAEDGSLKRWLQDLVSYEQSCIARNVPVESITSRSFARNPSSSSDNVTLSRTTANHVLKVARAANLMVNNTMAASGRKTAKKRKILSEPENE